MRGAGRPFGQGLTGGADGVGHLLRAGMRGAADDVAGIGGIDIVNAAGAGNPFAADQILVFSHRLPFAYVVEHGRLAGTRGIEENGFQHGTTGLRASNVRL